MDQVMYLMVVETEDGSGIFEVFDYFYAEKGTDLEIRWSKNSKPGSYLLDCSNLNNLTRNAFFDGEKFIPDPENPIINIDHFHGKAKSVAVLYNDRLYGLFHVEKDSSKCTRYEMAMHSKTMCLLNTADFTVNLGDIWNGKEFIKAERI